MKSHFSRAWMVAAFKSGYYQPMNASGDTSLARRPAPVELRISPRHPHPFAIPGTFSLTKSVGLASLQSQRIIAFLNRPHALRRFKARRVHPGWTRHAVICDASQGTRCGCNTSRFIALALRWLRPTSSPRSAGSQQPFHVAHTAGSR